MNEQIDLTNEPRTPLELARMLLEFAEHGDYSNGNEAFGVDEGRVMTADTLREYQKVLVKLERGKEEEDCEMWLRGVKWVAATFAKNMTLREIIESDFWPKELR